MRESETKIIIATFLVGRSNDVLARLPLLSLSVALVVLSDPVFL